MDEKFYGKVKELDNGLFIYKPIFDEDNIILRTQAVKRHKGRLVLVVGTGKVIFLQDWQVRPVEVELNNSWEKQFVVKLNRNYHKMYSIKEFEAINFYGFEFDFDACKEKAIAQEGTPVREI